MKSAFTDEQVIAAEREKVWRALTDWPNAGRWMPGIEEMAGPGEDAVGSVLHYRARGKERSSTITGLEPGRSITLRSAQAGVSADYVYELSDAEAGTRVRLDARVTTSGPMALLGPVIRSAIAKEDGGQLARLKAWVESIRTPA